jgi:hypothetical protein
MIFSECDPKWTATNNQWYWVTWDSYKFTVSSWSVTAITRYQNRIQLKSSAPTSWNNSTITFVI